MRENKDVSMLSLTHGQPATPTTMGKELANFAFRLELISRKTQKIKFFGKMNGAVGNYNSHYTINKETDWISLSKRFIEERLGL